jgi:hypothetical protein
MRALVRAHTCTSTEHWLDCGCVCMCAALSRCTSECDVYDMGLMQYLVLDGRRNHIVLCVLLISYRSLSSTEIPKLQRLHSSRWLAASFPNVPWSRLISVKRAIMLKTTNQWSIYLLPLMLTLSPSFCFGHIQTLYHVCDVIMMLMLTIVLPRVAH